METSQLGRRRRTSGGNRSDIPWRVEARACGQFESAVGSKRYLVHGR